MASGRPRPLIFISYSHRDMEAKEFVDRHLRVLRMAGNIDVWQDGEITVGDDWYEKIETRLNECAVAVLLISTDFLSSEFCIKEEVIRLLERRKHEGLMIAPILLRPCAWKIFPWLSALQMQPRGDVALLELGQFEQERELTAVVLAIHGYLEERAKLVETAVEQARETGQQTEIHGSNNTVVQVDGDHVTINIVAGPKADTEYPALPKGAVDITRLPTSGYDVVGRDRELTFLDQAFDEGDLNIVSLRAWGGVGKSTLVNKWCEYLAADNYRGAKRVFAWSFFSQGATTRMSSADAFIDAALTFFGDDDPANGSSWARGERLAHLIGREKALLILDGMEPLQDAYQGINDPALARLVECLAIDNAGLCIITTREPVKEFSDFSRTTHEEDLEQLSKQAGRVLLRIKGLRAGDDMLERVSEAFGNNGFALDLLASYLKGFADRDVEKALMIPDLPEVSVEAGKHARRIMAALAKRLGEGPALDLLHVMGLFDRPADGACLSALRAGPAIEDLTEKLSSLDELGWRDLVAGLRRLGLLAESNPHQPDELDAHPLVREHFGGELRSRSAKAWIAGHERLYEHLTTKTAFRPETLTQLTPLIQAVRHGCEAGRLQEALDDVYTERINHRSDFFLTKQLGALATNLGLIGCFFDPPFERPAADLQELDQAVLLHAAAHNLRGLGRLDEAVAPLRGAIQRHVSQKRWRHAAESASNLSEVKLALGEISAAMAAGSVAVLHADRSGDDFQRMAIRTALADARFQAGLLDEAKALFEEAEALQMNPWPRSSPLSSASRLYSIYGFRYCELLLDLGKAEAVRERAAAALRISEDHKESLSIALDKLSLGRAAQALNEPKEALPLLDAAVHGLRVAGTVDELPRGLLARAGYFRATGMNGKALIDLAEVMRIADRCKMRLHQCDAHLEYARLALADGTPEIALPHFQSAEKLVDDCGYHRRDDEIAELKERLGL